MPKKIDFDEISSNQADIEKTEEFDNDQFPLVEKKIEFDGDEFMKSVEREEFWRNCSDCSANEHSSICDDYINF